MGEVSKIAKDLLTKRGSVIIDDRTNTLIVTDLPRNIPVLDELIQTLDVQIPQVQIEARVVEDSKGWDREFGVKWPSSNNGDAKLQIADGTGKLVDAPWGSFGTTPSWNSDCGGLGWTGQAKPGLTGKIPDALVPFGALVGKGGAIDGRADVIRAARPG